jgi:hypothetical protein
LKTKIKVNQINQINQIKVNSNKVLKKEHNVWRDINKENRGREREREREKERERER